ncbi:PREDICTED: protein sprint [Ceratosolen solmsi marchali]|uniref:Protein sprint n=1 Tax=Ceratosolen solmsi marchali TaxID=326594 RepID=A0AAJ6YVR0_9HYME|nr:PREDICTED: protein sprint [Ceratosolen solmsi marchali]
MLPPIMNNISSEILTLYTSRNRNETNRTEGTVIHTTRARYAEIGVKRNDTFVEPYLQHQHEYEHRQQQQEHDNISVQSLNSPNSPPLDPLQQQLGQLHHVQSEDSLISESTDTSGSSSSNSTTEEDSSSEVTCNINLIERLIRSHPVWFLPGIQRAGAFHLLQGKEEGNFVVRQSSQSDTMALSVRLPPGKGPYIEHYLIQANKGKLSLETSENVFDNIPSLIAHYSQCCDELPVQLTLPKAMREAKNRQQLSSLALLGQEFWRYPMANSKSAESSSNNSNISSLSSFHTGNNNNHHRNHNNSLSTSAMENIVLNLTPISTKESENTPSINTKPTLTLTTLKPRLPRPKPPNTLNLTTFNDLLDIKRENKLSPNEKLSQRLISPNLVQNFVKSSSPLVHNIDAYVVSPANNLNSSCELIKVNKLNSNNSFITSNMHRNIANGSNNLSRKTSPNIIQTSTEEYHSKSPPPPPPRWAKPGQQMQETMQKNFLVTTCTTFTVNQNCDAEIIESASMDGNTPLLLSPQSAYSNKSLSSNPSSNKSSSTNSSSSILSPTPILLSVSSKLTNGIRTPQDLSPISITQSGTNKISRRRKERDARKNSQHYQESDIMESYCRSSPADKISDYEDIWNTADHSMSTKSAKNSMLTGIINETTKEQNNECGNKIVNPVIVQYQPCELNKNVQQRQLTTMHDKLIIRSDKTCVNEKLSYKKITSPEFSSFKPLQDIKNLKTISASNHMTIEKRLDLFSKVCSRNLVDRPSDLTSPCNNFSPVFDSSENNSSITSETKQSNSLYAEPADAITRPIIGFVARRHPKTLNKITNKFRHSEPSRLQTQLITNCSLEVTASHSNDCDDSEETEDKTPLISSSMDNLAKKLNTKEQKKCLPSVTKPVHPPKIKPRIFKDTSWTIDSSWEFIGHDTNECEPDCDYDVDYDSNYIGQNFPDEEQDKYILRNTLTAQSIILQRYPELLIQSDLAESLYSDRNSSYDNVEKRQERVSQTTSSTNMITTLDPKENRIYGPSESQAISKANDNDHERCNKSFKEQIDPLLSPPRLLVLKNRENVGDSSVTGLAIRTYALELATDKTTTFSQNIENFIQCTKEGKEASPHIVMRNMRQFMSGMKNYLVKHGEREFEKEVEKERLKLKANEFLNLDAILENVMMSLVVRPLREHVYNLFVEHYTANDSIQTLVESIQLAQSKPIQDFGVRPKIIPPTEASLNRILRYIERLQKVDSPFEKLEHLLAAISAIINSVKHANSSRSVTLGADDLLPLLVWVLVRGKIIDAEIEAEYMWGLLHPSLLTGEGGYYLTTLSSAVHVLKTFKSSQGSTSTTNYGCGTPDCSSVLRILVPDELHGSLNTRVLPIRPNMNTRDVCRILAHKIRCTNPQDYGLFKLVLGEETLLGDQECPQEISHCLFAYKRIDAKIAWPKTANSASVFNF